LRYIKKYENFNARVFIISSRTVKTIQYMKNYLLTENVVRLFVFKMRPRLSKSVG